MEFCSSEVSIQNDSQLLSLNPSVPSSVNLGLQVCFTALFCSAGMHMTLQSSCWLQSELTVTFLIYKASQLEAAQPAPPAVNACQPLG